MFGCASSAAMVESSPFVFRPVAQIHSPNGGNARVTPTPHQPLRVGLRKADPCRPQGTRLQHEPSRDLVSFEALLIGRRLQHERQHVDDHRGTLKIDSQPGVGTTMRIAIPAAPVQPASTPQPAAVEDPS